MYGLFSSDLVNGLVLLMNSNISSPVNLVSSWLSYKHRKKKSTEMLNVDTKVTEVYEIFVCLFVFSRETQRSTPYWSLLVSSKVSSVRCCTDKDHCQCDQTSVPVRLLFFLDCLIVSHMIFFLLCVFSYTLILKVTLLYLKVYC